MGIRHPYCIYIYLKLNIYNNYIFWVDNYGKIDFMAHIELSLKWSLKVSRDSISIPDITYAHKVFTIHRIHIGLVTLRADILMCAKSVHIM